MDMFSPEYRQLYQRLMGIYEHYSKDRPPRYSDRWFFNVAPDITAMRYSLKDGGVEINFLMKSRCRITIPCGVCSSHILFDCNLSPVFDDNPFPERLVLFDPDNTDWDELALRYMGIKSSRTKTNRAVESRD